MKPIASSPPPNHKTIGKPRAETERVPKEAPIIRAVVSLVRSSLLSVILAVREEYGTLTMVKHVLCNKLTVNKKTNNISPSNGGTQKSKTNERASGIAP